MKLSLEIVLFLYLLLQTGQELSPIEKYIDEQVCITDAECSTVFGDKAEVEAYELDLAEGKQR